MENEASLVEQIKSYIDQLDLLGMQETIDQARIDNVIELIKNFATEYEALLDKEAEISIQEIEKVYAQNLEEERNKRNDILSVAVKKLNTFSEIFFKVFQIKIAANLQDYINVIKDKLNSQVKDYEDDLNLVDEQLTATAKAEEVEASLNQEKKQAHIELTNLRNTQISYQQLNEEITALYLQILSEGNINQIDFVAVIEKEKALKKRQERYLENLELARTAKDAGEYVEAYERRVKNGNLELDKLAEKKFLHLINKMILKAPDSYEELEKRTETIQGLVKSRIAQVEKLYSEGVTTKEEYGTLASKINHEKIYSQLNDLYEMKENEHLIVTIEERLQHTREHIKSKDELEAIFAERAKERGREAIIPTVSKQPEILFEDEEIKPKEKKEKQNRHLVISVESPKKSLLEKISKAKDFLMNTITSVKGFSGKAKERIKNLITSPEEYRPTIGDKVKFGNGTKVFANPMEVVESKGGKKAKTIGLTETELYVTRGAILDETGMPLFITADYGVDLEKVAADMGLEPDSYFIALGCSIGDADGKFVAVTNDKLNPDIEKGWIDVDDSDLIIINQLSNELSKGGMNK